MTLQWFAGSQHQPFAFDAGRDDSAVLLLHGFLGTPAELRPLAASLVGVGVSSRAILLPGFGSDIANLGSVTRADWIAIASDALTELRARFERVSIVGYSMGGALALHLAARMPVDRLVLIAPLWKLLGGAPMLRALPLAKRVVRQIHPFGKADFSDPQVRQYFAGSMSGFDLDDPATQRALREETTLPLRTVDELRRLSLDAGALARHVYAPTLIIQGLQDTTVFPRHTRELVSRLPGRIAFHQIMAGHLLTLADQPGWTAVRDLVVPFVAFGCDADACASSATDTLLSERAS